MLLLKLSELPWYLMSQKNQLEYAQALNRLQNGAVIAMGPFFELNYEIFSDVSNIILQTWGIYVFVITIPIRTDLNYSELLFQHLHYCVIINQCKHSHRHSYTCECDVNIVSYNSKCEYLH